MMTKSSAQSPIFVKSYDFLLWLLPLTLKFPKSQRFLLAERLGKLALEFYELILEAVLDTPEAAGKLDQADLLLHKIRLYVRLSMDLKCISTGQYEHAVLRIDELGRLTGGWKKKRLAAKII